VGWTTEESGFDYLQGQEIFLYGIQTGSTSYTVLYPLSTWRYFPGDKATGA
jgi:hypothetical protein